MEEKWEPVHPDVDCQFQREVPVKATPGDVERDGGAGGGQCWKKKGQRIL